MTTTTYTGLPASDKIECLNDHQFETVDSNYVCECKECSICGFRIAVVRPVAAVDFAWLNHQ